MNSTRLNITLLTLSMAYTVFAIPIVPVELGFVNPFWAMCIYSWYWWMYAINVIVYVVTSKDFRSVYSIFLRDLTYPVRTFVVWCFSEKHWARIQFFIQKRLKNTNITAEYTSTGLLLPIKASHTLAQTMEYFQGYYKRLGFCVNKSKNQRSWLSRIYKYIWKLVCEKCQSFKLSLWWARLSSTPGYSEPTRFGMIRSKQFYPALLSTSSSSWSPCGCR